MREGTNQTTSGMLYTDAHDLAGHIAAKIFPDVNDAPRQAELRILLMAFASEIRRSAIEP